MFRQPVNTYFTLVKSDNKHLRKHPHQSMILVDLHGLGTVGLRGDGAQLGVQHVDGTVEQLVIRRV